MSKMNEYKLEDFKRDSLRMEELIKTIKNPENLMDLKKRLPKKNNYSHFRA